MLFWLQIVRIAETKDGILDLKDLEEQLSLHQNITGQLIGCFSAASNVTGIIVDDGAVTSLLHRHGARAFWDYTVAAPSVSIDMSPDSEGNAAYKDAIFFSAHKFVGGVQTPGILVIRKSQLKRGVGEENQGFFEPQEKDQVSLC